MKFNIWSAIIIVLICFLLVALFYLFGMIKKADNNYAMILGQKTSLEADIEKISEIKKSLESEVTGMRIERDGLVAKIADFNIRMQKMGDDHKNEIEAMASEIGVLKGALAKKAAELPKKDSQIEALMVKIRKGEKKIAHLLNANKTVNLNPITVNPPSAKLDAVVLDVNKDYGFIVIDAGTSKEVRPGDTLFVFRKGSLLGKVVVEKADVSTCVAKVLYKSLADEVRKGDSVSN